MDTIQCGIEESRFIHSGCFEVYRVIIGQIPNVSDEAICAFPVTDVSLCACQGAEL